MYGIIKNHSTSVTIEHKFKNLKSKGILLIKLFLVLKTFNQIESNKISTTIKILSVSGSLITFL